MSELDKIKDALNNLRLYLSFLVAILLALGKGILGVYQETRMVHIFWIGIGLFVLLSFLFVYVSYQLYKKTDELREL